MLSVLQYCILTFTLLQNNPGPDGHSKGKSAVLYVCSPCGYECDKRVFNAPGICPFCHMPLVRKSSIRFKSIAPREIHQYLIDHPRAVLLDVRTAEEFAGKADPNFGTLKKAINIPVQELGSRLSSIDSLKSREIIVYCSHAHRSAQASYLLTQHGFRKVLNMTGGVSTMSDSVYKPDFK